MIIFACETLEQAMSIKTMMDVLFRAHLAFFRGDEGAAQMATEYALANFAANWWVEN